MYRAALADIVQVWTTRAGWIAFARNDIKQRHRRAILGRLWIVLALGLTVLTLGLIYAAVMNQPLGEYLAYIAAGLVVWYLMAGLLSEAAIAFIGSEGLIKAVKVPKSFFVARLIAKHLMIFAGNLTLIVAVYIFTPPKNLLGIIYAIPGLMLLIINMSWIVLLIGSLAVRFRDVVPLSASAVQILFLITPVIYRPEQLSGNLTYVSRFNPLANLIAVVREPLLGEAPTLWNWTFCVMMAAVGWPIAFLVFAQVRKKIALWL